MKKIYLLLLLTTLITTGFGCREDATQTFTTTDCPAMLDGWEEKQSARFLEGEQLFLNENNWGLRCRYYEPKAEEFDIAHAEGKSTGDFQNHYELEIRKFSDEYEKDIFYTDTITEMLSSYCRAGSEVVVPLLLNEDAVNERYQCSWPAEQNQDSLDQINTNSLISITKYKNAVIITGIVKEQGQLNFIPTDYAAITDVYEEKSFLASQYVYESSEFQIIPDEHEQYLIDHAISVIDNL